MILGLKQLLDAQQLCDVTLLVEGKKFMCHRYRESDIVYEAQYRVTLHTHKEAQFN